MEKIVLISILIILAGCYKHQDEYYVNIIPDEHYMEQLATTIDNTQDILVDPLEELIS